MGYAGAFVREENRLDFDKQVAGIRVVVLDQHIIAAVSLGARLAVSAQASSGITTRHGMRECFFAPHPHEKVQNKQYR